MSRPARIAAISAAVLAALLLLYAGVGTLVVPRVLASQLEQLARDELSLEASTTDIRFDPFRLRLVVEGFALGEMGAPPQAAFDVLRVDLDAPALLGRVVAVDELYLAGARIEIRVSEAGAVSVGGVPLGAEDAAAEGQGEAPPDEPEPSEPGEPPLEQLVIRRLVIERGKLQLLDASRDPVAEREIGPIDLAVEALDLTVLLRTEGVGAQRSAAALEIHLPEGAQLVVRGDLEVRPVRLDLAFELSKFPLASLQPWVAPFVRAELRGGLLDAQGHVAMGLEPEAPDSVGVEGSLGVSGLEVGEPGVDEPMLAWKALDVAEIAVSSAPLVVRVGSVSLAEPVARLVLSANGLNAVTAFAPDEGEGRDAPEPPAPEPAADAEPLVVEVGSIDVSKGRVRFEDRTIEPSYTLELVGLDVHVDPFSLDPKSRSRVKLAAKLDGYAPLALDGSLAPLAPREFTDLALGIEQLEIASFSPYSGRFVGRELEGGRFSLDVKVGISDEHVDGKNRVVVERLLFGKGVESPAATTLPVATAAGLLADADGQIVIDVPVKGDFDDPGFSYGGALLDTLRTLITRVVATPFKMVGGMVSLGGKLFRPEDLRVIGFAPGSTAIEGEEILKLDGLAAALVQNPELEIEVRGGADPAVDDADLRALARQRAGAVRDQLVARGVEASRVRIGDVSLSASDGAADGGAVLTHLEIR
jgi:hypothetical protein